MLWKLIYSDYRIKEELAEGKENAWNKAKATLLTYPYLNVDLFKIKGDKRIYVATYEFDVQAHNKDGSVRLKQRS